MKISRCFLFLSACSTSLTVGFSPSQRAFCVTLTMQKLSASASSTTSASPPLAAEYKDLIQNLASQMKEVRGSLQKLKDKATKLQEFEIHDPAVAAGIGELSADLKIALAEAKAADDVYGPNSDRSYWRWRNVEDIALGRLNINCIDGEVATQYDEPNVRYLMEALENHHHDYSLVVDPESLREAIDSIGRIEHLDRLVRIENDRMEKDE